MPGGLKCSMHWYALVSSTSRNMTLAVERDVKQQINPNTVTDEHGSNCKDDNRKRQKELFNKFV